MNRIRIFAFRVSNDERRAIADLAAQLRRSKSDAVRFVVVEVAKQLMQAETTTPAVLPIMHPKPSDIGKHV